MKKKIFVCLLVLLFSASSANAEPIQWEDNGHYYEIVSGTFTWMEAKLYAESLSYLSVYGNLATITSREENRWITDNLGGLSALDGRWLGGYQDKSAPDCTEPDGGWRWVTGENWDYTCWYSGEPNNSGGEDFTSFHSYLHEDGLPWNDSRGLLSPKGFLIEYPIPEPSTIALLITGLIASGLYLLRRK